MVQSVENIRYVENPKDMLLIVLTLMGNHRYIWGSDLEYKLSYVLSNSIVSLSLEFIYISNTYIYF
jgi:hypothetical protein